MNIPVYSTPGILEELMESYRPCFNDRRQFKHFEELISAFNTSDRKSIAHLNSTIINHTNQSSMNRFLSSGINMNLMFSRTIEKINTIEDNGILAIDDTIVEKTGKNIEAAGWFYDHSKGKNVYGMQFVTSVFSGEYGIYPVNIEVYRKKEYAGKEYKTKIEMQIETIKRCMEEKLNFSMVAGDTWYFTEDIVSFLNENNLDWISGCKGNRNIKFRGRWTTPDKINLPYRDSISIRVSGDNYSVWEIEARIRGIGNVKLIISEGIHGRRYYATNLIELKAKALLELYLKRWDIEVIHKGLKQGGLGHIFLRKLCSTGRYLCLIVTGRVLLEISGIRSLNKYPDSPIEKRKKWISFEFLESLFNGFRQYGNKFVQAVKRSLFTPYKSTRNVLKYENNLNIMVTI